jgi:hypothetical protein
MNIVVIDDNEIIVSNSSQADDLYTVISTHYGINYGTQHVNMNYYKTQLISLYGTIDFSDTPLISTLKAHNNKHSILYYLPNITGVKADGCTNLSFTDNSILLDNK